MSLKMNLSYFTLPCSTQSSLTLIHYDPPGSFQPFMYYRLHITMHKKIQNVSVV